ncbi:hypothetical protein PVAND_015247 [Polypedilum vanderplanki]|uniref:Uncharacterized protein n=1 Tax=Polypedilum vanderplanki TaxID=319348 RepID=A0A9J6BCI4_POLVA|nr:hypothetical protein PVAND_015247 [Polypedilum vanderplanki]
MMKVFFVLGLACYCAATQSKEEKKPDLECGNKFYRYYLDDAPAKYGLSAGYYAPGKEAYVAIGNWQCAVLNSGRLQLDPPGVLLPNLGGPGTFLNDSHQMWYFYKNPHHEYKWVDTNNGEIVPYAIDFNTEI